MDARLVREIAHKFFLHVYTTYNGHAFMSKPFYFSAANLAWESWAQQYLKYDILTEESCLEAERLSYRGGMTCAFRTTLVAGIAIDINSSYPASMMNIMPLRHIANPLTG